MAQSKSFFGLRKGSTKSLTFQVLNGKQITKDRVYNVKNPQTIAQMQQRALMATAVTAYSRLKAICDHSFEGIEVGAKTMSEFIKNNLAILSNQQPNINITSYKEGDYAYNKYMVSKGTLVPATTSFEAGNFMVHTKVVSENPPKWGDIAASMGIKKGGMLTILLISEGKLYWLRYKFNDAMWDTNVVNGESNIAQLAKLDAIEGNSTELNDSLDIAKDSSNNEWKFTLGMVDAISSAAAIISEKTEGQWKRSTAYMEGEFNFLYDAAFMTYPVNTTLLLNGGKMATNIIQK